LGKGELQDAVLVRGARSAQALGPLQEDVEGEERSAKDEEARRLAVGRRSRGGSQGRSRVVRLGYVNGTGRSRAVADPGTAAGSRLTNDVFAKGADQRELGRDAARRPTPDRGRTTPRPCPQDRRDR
jgi:hypothetical protein